MDDSAFHPGAEEMQLEEHQSVLSGQGRPKIGHALLTNDRIVFVDQKYNPGAAGAVGGVLAAGLAAKLNKRHEGKPPVLDLPITEITRVARAKKFMNKDILVFEAGGVERRLNDGYNKWEPLLRRALTERHGKTVSQETDDAWRVT